ATLPSLFSGRDCRKGCPSSRDRLRVHRRSVQQPVTCPAVFLFPANITNSVSEDSMNPIIIHTDGSCETQTRRGGWAAILQCGDHRRELNGSAVDTTVNVMELTAVIEAISALKQPGAAVQIIIDSNYVVKGINEWLPDWIARGWKTAGKKPVANHDLWEQLQALIAQHNVTFT